MHTGAKRFCRFLHIGVLTSTAALCFRPGTLLPCREEIVELTASKRLIDMAEMNCPRCEASIRKGTYGPVTLSLCRSCEGVTLKRVDILRVLDPLAGDISNNVNINSPLPPTKDSSGLINCPECKRPMERYGYMGSNKLIIDGCELCNRVWLDPEELACMVHMHMTFDYNADKYNNRYTPVDIVGTHMWAAAVSAAMLGGFILF